MSKFKVGDEVYCFANGDGVVCSIEGCCTYPVRVNFTNKGYDTYTKDGFRHESHENPCLYPRGTKITIEEPEPVIPENTLVWAWNDGDTKASLYLRAGPRGAVKGMAGNLLFDFWQVAEINEDGTVKPFEGVGNEA